MYEPAIRQSACVGHEAIGTVAYHTQSNEFSSLSFIGVFRSY